MIYTRTGEAKSIDWGAVGKVAVLQSVDFALVTPKNSHYMDREAGWEIPVGETISEALENQMSGDIANMLFEQFEENGVSVNAVDFAYDENLQIKPIIEMELIEDDEI